MVEYNLNTFLSYCVKETETEDRKKRCWSKKKSKKKN